MSGLDKVVICRCEEITEAQIISAFAAGYQTVEELKRHLRLGMGPCQGRTCMPMVLAIVARLSKVPIAQVAPAVTRPPLKPVPLAAYARLEEQRR
jgi:NAD(P)H-nitrite reductase large subunit